MVKVLVCDKIGDEGISLMEKAGLKVDFRPDLNPEELEEAIRDYDVVVVRSKTKITGEVLKSASNVKLIVRSGVGLDNIDLRTAKNRGVTVMNTPEAVTDAVAELTVGLILAVARHIPAADRSLKDGKWLKKKLVGQQLKGKTLGIVGFGRIGQRVAEIGRAMGMKIIVREIYLNEDMLRKVEGKNVPLEKLLAESDFIALHLPAIPETHHMIGSKEFALMKDGAVILNTARGALIDEEALLSALNSGKLGGAAVDVYEVEPPTNMKLVTHPKVVCTPHIGTQTENAQKDASITCAKKVIEFFRAKSPS